MTAVHLQADNISWQVDNKVIVDHVSLSAIKGEMLGIVGPNGAGKTSLLKCLYQEHMLCSGDVKLAGKPLLSYSKKQIAQKIAVVSQHHDPVFSLSVFDIVHMGLIPHKSYFEQDNSEDLQLIELALSKVDLTDKREQAFNTLSGGEQQRCLIARAIVQRPQILIMDEPTNHLDVYYQHQILSIVKKLNLTLIITIHDLNLAAQYCDRLLLIADGKLKALDSPENVLNESLLKDIFRLTCVVDQNPITGKPRVTFAGGDCER